MLTEHVGLESLENCGENTMSEKAIHDRGRKLCWVLLMNAAVAFNSLLNLYSSDLAWLTESDFIVAECTAASLGVGYEIGMYF